MKTETKFNVIIITVWVILFITLFLALSGCGSIDPVQDTGCSQSYYNYYQQGCTINEPNGNYSYSNDEAVLFCREVEGEVRPKSELCKQSFQEWLNCMAYTEFVLCRECDVKRERMVDQCWSWD